MGYLQPSKGDTLKIIGLAGVLLLATSAADGEQPSIIERMAASPEVELAAPDLYEQVSPSVVQVTARGSNYQAMSRGTGFVISAEGLVATNHHVVEDAQFIFVEFRDGQIKTAEVLSVDADADVAVLRVPGEVGPAVRIGSIEALKVGMTVYTIGHPQGLRLTFSQGIISSFRGDGKGHTLIQTTAAISHGSSGGPLFTTNGTVVGITTAYIAGGQNLNFAVPATIATNLAPDPRTTREGLGEVSPELAHDLRVISLTPAISQMLIDLGVGERMVAVSENDIAATDGLPVVGVDPDVDTDRLVAIGPTHVMVMHGRNDLPESLVRQAGTAKMAFAGYQYPETIDDVLAILAGPLEGQQPVGAFISRAEQAKQLAESIRKQFAAIAQGVEGRPRPRVLMLFGTEPMMAAGKGIVLDELLHIAGGENAAAASSLTVPVYDRESLRDLAPEVILLLIPGARPLAENIQDDPRLADLADLAIPAVRNRRVVLLNDPLVLLPSTQMPRIAAAMAKAIHPDVASKIDGVLDDPR